MRSKGGDRDEKKILRGLVSSSTLSRSPLLSYGSRGRCQDCLWRPSSSRRLPFQPKVSSDIGGEESALQVALNQSQRQTQWFTEVNPERKVFMVKFDDKWVADSDVIVGIIEEKYPEPSLKTPPVFASVISMLFADANSPDLMCFFWPICALVIWNSDKSGRNHESTTKRKRQPYENVVPL